MLYASIALVAAGIALIAYSLMTRGRARIAFVAEGTVPHPRDEGPVNVPGASPSSGEARDSNRPLSEPVMPAVRVQAAEAGEERGQAAKPLPPADKQSQSSVAARTKASTGAAVKTATVPEKEVPGDADMAVLFNDASGVVDYEGRENQIDPSFKKYSKLKRVGRGHVGIVKDGINFQLRKKLYRFEFFRIEKILPGKNYIALFIKGSEEVKLMIFDRENDMDRRLMSEFNAYRKRSL